MSYLKRSLVKLTAIVGSAMLIGSCATLTKQECMMGNWQAIGYADGVGGSSAARIALHNKACSKASVAPDYKLWEQGRQEGLKQYCTKDIAYRMGKRGRVMNMVCPADIAPMLERTNADGLSYYDLSKQLSQERERLKKHVDEFKRLRNGENLTFTSEKDARIYLSELPRRMRQVQSRIDNLKIAIAKLQNKYGY